MILSIIIPIYNSEKYIRDCLDNCILQNIAIEDYEILCIDDGSTDNSLSILQEYEKKYNNIRIIHKIRNLGVSSARNTGMENMKGDYCWFIDADDFITDNCIKNLLLTDYDVINVGRSDFISNNSKNENIKNSEYKGTKSGGYITSRIIKSSIIGNLRFQENVVYGEDELFLFEIMYNEPKCVDIDEPIYYYRIHSDSAMALTKSKRLIRIDSLINSSIYLLGNYYPYSDNTIHFINNRVNMAFSDIALQKFSIRLKKLAELYKLGLINHKIDTTIVGNLSKYFIIRLNTTIIGKIYRFFKNRISIS